jgi:hypothetical protein
MTRCYDLNGLRLDVETETPDLIAPIEHYVAPFATEGLGAPTYSISIGSGPLDKPPTSAQILFAGDVADGVRSRLAVHDECYWVISPDRFSIATDRGARATRIRLSDHCDRASASRAGIYAIDMALAASGQHLVHGAALVPPLDVPRALLIFAPSGIGKTTTALALALGGFGLITDDAIVLQQHGSCKSAQIRAWGLPRPLKVHRRTAELLPSIAPLLAANWDSAGEQPLQLAALRGLAPTPAPAPIEIAAIAFLGERSVDGHQIAPLEKANALARLAQDNIRRFAYGLLPDHAARFTVLGALVAATPSFELRIGAPLETLPQTVVTAVSRESVEARR